MTSDRASIDSILRPAEIAAAFDALNHAVRLLGPPRSRDEELVFGLLSKAIELLDNILAESLDTGVRP